MKIKVKKLKNTKENVINRIILERKDQISIFCNRQKLTLNKDPLKCDKGQWNPLINHKKLSELVNSNVWFHKACMTT